jgi:hypothetical protein
MSAECGGAITFDVSGMPGLTYDPVTGILGADAGAKVVVMFGAGGVVTGSLRRVVKQSGSILRLEILPPPLPAAGSQPITIAVTAKAGAPASSAAVTVTFLPRNAPSLICNPSPCQSASDGGAVPVKVNITGLLLAEDTPIDEQLRVTIGGVAVSSLVIVSSSNGGGAANPPGAVISVQPPKLGGADTAAGSVVTQLAVSLSRACRTAV